MIVGLGTDLLDIRRLQKAVERQGSRFLEKLFTEDERNFCDSRKANPYATYGTTFAAKEATLKAIGHTDGIQWHNIEIVRLPNGKPTVQLHDTAHKRCLELTDSQPYVIHLTLTDEPPYAQAFVVIEKIKF